VVNLSKIAVQTGGPLRYDSKAEKFIDDEQANSFIQQPMRAPWKIEV
jgi:myo-inositol 2-dehydrogenase / D-chiro-inositol 1-dehydrogenase